MQPAGLAGHYINLHLANLTLLNSFNFEKLEAKSIYSLWLQLVFLQV